MIELAFILALSCPTPKTVNQTDWPWNTHDRETEAYCSKRCSKEYDDAPCLKLFIKWDAQDYHCICGKAQEVVYCTVGELDGKDKKSQIYRRKSARI